MKVLANFDRVVTEVLADKVKSKMSFKVSSVVLFQLFPPSGLAGLILLTLHYFCPVV